MNALHEFVMGRGPIEDLLSWRRAALACKKLLQALSTIFAGLATGALLTWHPTVANSVLPTMWIAAAGVCGLAQWYYHKKARGYVKQLERLGLGPLLLILLRVR